MRSRLLALLLLLLIAGCSGIPFQEPASLRMESIDPAAVIVRLRSALPERFRATSSVVVEMAGRSVSALGITEVDRVAGTFTAVALNPMGLKLFELTGAPDGTISGSVLEAISQRGNAAAAIGEDIRRIYLDLVPSPVARSWKRARALVFRQPSGGGELEYVFAGEGPDLAEKNFYGDDGIVWQAAYYEYGDWNGKRMPHGIVYRSYRHGYRLIIRMKEILA